MRSYFVTLLLILALQLLPLRRAMGEDRLDLKYMYYQEDGGRIGVQSPAVLYETDLSPTLTIKLEGIYDSISGATPTGNPKAATSRRAETPATYDNQNTSGTIPDYTYRSGASSKPKPKPKPKPAPEPPPPPVVTKNQKVQTEKIEDERIAVNLDVTKRLGNHSVGGMLSLSTENDYDSYGLSVRDAIDFNQKNTTLLAGAAFTHDLIDGAYEGDSETKDSVDAMIGLTQVLSPSTLFTVNLTLGQVSGYLDDPYKVVDLNGSAVPEKRPDNKDKKILYLALNQAFAEANGSAEVSYRYYDDSFGITAHTVEFAWYQKLGPEFILRPSLRLYEQSEADFYGLHFTGDPDAYSSDYRLSGLTAVGYGLKLIWSPNSSFSADIGYERYEQEGTDDETPSDAYPGANIIVVGARWWL